MDWEGEVTHNIPVLPLLDNELLAIVKPLPKVPDTITKVSTEGITMNFRGLSYMPAIHGATTARLQYYIQGDDTCGRGEKTVVNNDNATITSCLVTLH